MTIHKSEMEHSKLPLERSEKSEITNKSEIKNKSEIEHPKSEIQTC
jgi:hypothetical protein